MSWTWRYERVDGSPVALHDGIEPAAPAEGFPSQSDAETWVGEVWRDLLGAGVDAVTLLEGDRVVYAGMSLHPPAS
ncbi:MAG: hypothetical protein EPO13_00595 [Actinomycetota bacterium]|nr:MAG: hypothetical protein EPO13_00595 [Actinomycetota bacterium]